MVRTLGGIEATDASSPTVKAGRLAVREMRREPDPAILGFVRQLV